jgi:hypothetical protein
MNRYRATIGLRPLTRSSALEDFAAQAAEHDAQVRTPHAFFTRTNGAGVARAETQVLWWKGFAVRDVVRQGLAQMWRVGPGGSHYDIIAGNFSEVGCGVYIADGEVTISQDFR